MRRARHVVGQEHARGLLGGLAQGRERGRLADQPLVRDDAPGLVHRHPGERRVLRPGPKRAQVQDGPEERRGGQHRDDALARLGQARGRGGGAQEVRLVGHDGRL